MKKSMWKSESINQIARLALMMMALTIPAVPSELPISNSAGVSLVREAAESYAGAEQTNAVGVTLSVAGAFDKATESSNAADVSAFTGLIDPHPSVRNAAGVTWLLYAGSEE